jgi:hypothetical protein
MGNKMKKLCLIFLVLASMSAGGCATITSSENQQLALTTKGDDGKVVEGVKCTFKNDKGSWEGTSPAFVSVRRSSQDLNVECKKEGMQDGMMRVVSRAAAGMFGNIIFGGGIGALIDHTKGTGYNYPDSVPVVMGQSGTADRRDQGNPQQAVSAEAPAATPPGQPPAAQAVR